MDWEGVFGFQIICVRLGSVITRASHPEMTVDSTKNKELGVKITFSSIKITGNTDGTRRYRLLLHPSDMQGALLLPMAVMYLVQSKRKGISSSCGNNSCACIGAFMASMMKSIYSSHNRRSEDLWLRGDLVRGSLDCLIVDIHKGNDTTSGQTESFGTARWCW